MQMEDRKTACVLVNYNDADTVLAQLKRIEAYESLSHIIVVDNDSADLSAVRLESYAEGRKKIEVIRAERNGGYSYGNQIGILRARYGLGCSYVLVANPDTIFTEEQVRKMAARLKKYPKLACISPLLRQQNRKDIDTLHYPPAYPLRPWLYEILDFLPLCRRLFHGILHYKADFYRSKRKGSCIKVDAVAGSLLMLQADRFLEAGGYDQGVFLYQEEHIVGQRLKRYGYETAILAGEYYIHAHSASISKCFSSLLARQKLREESALYYYRRYLNISPLQEGISRLVFFTVRLEIVLFHLMKKIL